MEIELLLTTIVSLVVGVLLGRYTLSRGPQKHIHSSSGLVYWLENDMVVITDTAGGNRREANINFVDECVFNRVHVFWNGDYGEDSVSIVVGGTFNK